MFTNGSPVRDNRAREIQPVEELPRLTHIVEYKGSFVLATANQRLANRMAELLNFYQRLAGLGDNNSVRIVPVDEVLPLLMYVVEYGGFGGRFVLACSDKKLAEKMAQLLNNYQSPAPDDGGIILPGV
jgi:hypothetical protein